jgi:cysteinyl-tRNA synthetase
MSEVELGLPFDIHGGGSDLIFPHHENEIAQSEAATGTPFANVWLHGGMLNINSEKMSKSLGNFTLAKDVLAYCPVPVLRLLMLQTHYRSQLEFSSERLDEARTAYERLTTARDKARWLAARPAPGAGAPEADRLAMVAAVAEARARFVADMDDDFNSAGALGALFDLARVVNGFGSSNEAVLGDADLVVLSTAADTLEELLGVMGAPLPLERTLVFTQTADGIVVDPLVELAAAVAAYAGSDHAEAEAAILAKRATARAEKDWPAADALRERLTAIGYAVEDGASGSRLVAAAS